ncbi:hypothetical protein [Luteimicrobium subarcticum]|uniref:ABC-type phosphate transport system substrate-binding protein n=1 Tax=Luteimicrobium subarcticum TaxID=620910 RepID=A0A2M8WSV3_9MICO|nr:hypothetical protein [Luteimicrobium subarcticum]PJI94035.1 hypothetical protein CLV34_1519 [Luteimicrobium subarcticum]
MSPRTRTRTLRRVGSALAVTGIGLTLCSGVLAVAAGAATPTPSPTVGTTGLPAGEQTAAGADPATADPAPTTTAPADTPTGTATTTPGQGATDVPTDTPTDTPTTGTAGTPTDSPSATPTGSPTTPPVSLPAGFPTTSSTTTVSWVDGPGHDASDPSYDALHDLSLTVNQTKNVTNQGLTLAWSGAPATSNGRFAANYLQVMQCWGDATTGPTPEQCQWGAPASGLSGLLGDRVGGRTLRAGEDPAQAYTDDYLVPPPLTNPFLRAYAVPFTAVDGTKVWDTSSYFTAATTNELTAVRTGSDGTGTTVFTTQTTLEAPQLGCGDRLTRTTARSCWLVVVPRTDVTADGTPVAQTPDGSMSGSPLSASVWRDRIVVPLGFRPVGSACAIGADEQRVVGHELVADAVTSWQPALCAKGTTYGFSQIGDDEARSQLTSTVEGASRIAFVQDPVDPATAMGAGIQYAPVAQSALVVAYNIDVYDAPGTPGAARNGTPVTDLTLDARLLAKLLTQSYRADVPGGGGKEIAKNPRSIVNDPEFVRLNPDLADFVPASAPDGLLVSLGSSDAAAQLWDWVRADPHAAAFLRGAPDEWGMVINPSYLALGLATDPTLDSYPKADLSTYRQDDTVPAPGYGTLDMRPYMADMQEAARRAQRADAGGKTVWDPTKLPPAFTSSGAQLPGQRFELALTDLSSAERYGLRTAKIVSATGDAVAASDATVRAAVAAMPESATVPGVKVPDPDARVLGAYPLATVSYAAVAVCLATPQDRSAAATFLDLATTTGQVVGDAPGQLPRGYVPLSATDARRGAGLAALLRSPARVAATCPKHSDGPDGTGDGTDDGSPGGTDDGTSTPLPGGTGAGDGGVGGPGTDVTTLPAGPADAGAGQDPDGATGGAAAASGETVAPQVTPASVTAFRLGLAGCLGVGLPCAVAGPILMRRATLLEARAALLAVV